MSACVLSRGRQRGDWIAMLLLRCLFLAAQRALTPECRGTTRAGVGLPADVQAGGLPLRATDFGSPTDCETPVNCWGPTAESALPARRTGTPCQPARTREKYTDLASRSTIGTRRRERRERLARGREPVYRPDYVACTGSERPAPRFGNRGVVPAGPEQQPAPHCDCTPWPSALQASRTVR